MESNGDVPLIQNSKHKPAASTEIIHSDKKNQVSLGFIVGKTLHPLQHPSINTLSEGTIWSTYAKNCRSVHGF